MAEQILEGTWEEIVRHANELAGKRVRLTVIEEAPLPRPNEAMLSALRKIAEIQQDMKPTPSEDTQTLLREAREGGMYGLNPVPYESYL